MTKKYEPSEYAAGYLDEMKKGHAAMKERCETFETAHGSFCARIGLDIDAFNIEKHPEHPAEGIFMAMRMSERDRELLGGYLRDREMMYLLEQCVRNIKDDETRLLAEAYYLQGKKQMEIAKEVGHGKSYVSKRLDKAEKGDMAETIDIYLAWKYGVPGGKDCFWAGDIEKSYMWRQDAMRGTVRMRDISKLPWVKELHRMGF